MERERERENVSMAAESGGFSLLPNLNFNKGGLLVNAVCHDSRRKRIPMRNTTVSKKKHSQKFSIVTLFR